MIRSTLSYALTLLLVAAPAALTAVGCGGGGSSSRSLAAAAITSQTPTSPAPDPGGQIAALGTQATAVNAQVGLNAYAAFRERAALSDAAIPDAPGLRDRAFVVEDDGHVRVLSLAGATPTLDRAIPLPGAPFAAGIAAGALSIQDERTALVTSSGAGGEAVYLFDPSTALAAGDVTKLTLSGLTLSWPAGTLNSKGVDVGARALPITYTSGAALSHQRLFVCASNLDAAFDYNPGAVLAFDVDPVTKALSNGVVFRTTDFNPTALTRVRTARGELILCTSSGTFGAGTSSIDVIDPVSLQLKATIPLGRRDAAGPIVVSKDGRRGYLGSQAAAEVYVLDLSNLGDELQNPTTTARPARYLGGYTLPTTGGFAYVSGLALSHSGTYLYAVNFNQSELFVIDLTTSPQPGLAAKATGFKRSGNVANYEGLASKVVVRPGVPGTDFTGPSLYVATINLAVADQTITNVKVALDSVTLDRH